MPLIVNRNSSTLEADLNLNVQTSGIPEAKAGLDQAATNAQKAQQNFDKVSAAFDRTMDRIKRTAAAFAAVTLGREAVVGLSKLVGEGVRYNAMIEDSRVAIGTLLTTGYDYIDKASGKALTGTAKMNAAMEHAADVQEKLKMKNLETAATYEQLVRVFQEALPYAIQTGMKVGEEELVEFSSVIAKVAKNAMVPLDQLGEEVRSILSGNMRTRNTRLAGIIVSGLGVADIEQANAKLRQLVQSGGMYQTLMKSLKPFLDATAISQGNLTTIWSNFKDVVSMTLGESTLDMFYELKRALVDITNYIAPINKETGRMEINKDVVQVAKKLADALGGILVGSLAVIKFTSSLYGALGPMGELVGFATKLLLILGAIAVVNKGVGMLGHGFQKLGQFIKTNLLTAFVGTFNALPEFARKGALGAADAFTNAFKGKFDSSKKLWQNPFTDGSFSITKGAGAYYTGAVGTMEKILGSGGAVFDGIAAKVNRLTSSTISWGSALSSRVAAGWQNVAAAMNRSWEASFKLQKSAPQGPGTYSKTANALAFPLEFAISSKVRGEFFDSIKSKIQSLGSTGVSFGQMMRQGTLTAVFGWENLKLSVGNAGKAMKDFVSGGWSTFATSLSGSLDKLKNMDITWGSVSSGIGKASGMMAGFVKLGVRFATVGLNAYLAWKMLEGINLPFSDSTFGDMATKIKLWYNEFRASKLLQTGQMTKDQYEMMRVVDKAEREQMEKNIEYRKMQSEKSQELVKKEVEVERVLRRSGSKGLFSVSEMEHVQKFMKDMEESLKKVEKETRSLDNAAIVAGFEAVGNGVDAALVQHAAKLQEAYKEQEVFWNTILVMKADLAALEDELVKVAKGTEEYAEKLKEVVSQQEKLAKVEKTYMDWEKAAQREKKAQDYKSIHQEEVKRMEDLYKQRASYYNLVGQGQRALEQEAAAERYATEEKIKGLSKSVKGYKEYADALRQATEAKIANSAREYEGKQDKSLYDSRAAAQRAMGDELAAIEAEYQSKMADIRTKIYEDSERGRETKRNEIESANLDRSIKMMEAELNAFTALSTERVGIYESEGNERARIAEETARRIREIEDEYSTGKHGPVGSAKADEWRALAEQNARLSGQRKGREADLNVYSGMSDYKTKLAEQSSSRIQMAMAEVSALESEWAQEADKWRGHQEVLLQVNMYYQEKIRRAREAASDSTYGGIEDGFRRLQAETKTWYENMSDLTVNVAHGIGDAFGSMFDDIGTKGKSVFDGLASAATNMLKNILSAMNKALGNYIAAQMLGGLGISLGKNALGNVFQNGSTVQAFAQGGILNGPIVFPMANGAGLAGEAGPEAVVPLRRGRNGRLGIDGYGFGGGGGGELTIKLDMKNRTNQPLSASQEGSPYFNGTELIVPVVIDAFNNNKMGLRTLITQGKAT